ncbi:MAG: sortase-associated OmpA-like protein PdsO [Glaciecola sp.]|nr:sortase-associated OmpA-like protein PdsO [Glaciecola sp.]
MSYSHFITGAALCVVATCSAAQTSTAERTEKNVAAAQSTSNNHINAESTHSAYGFGGGLLAGAALGGPVGAIIGATLGVLMVEEHNDDNHIESLQHDLVVARHALSAKDEELVALVSAQQQQYQPIQPVSYTTTIVPDFPEMKSHIQFISGMTDIAPSYFEQLDLLANVLKDNQKLQVSVTGFADLRGTSEDNLLLSAARTEAVKDYLLNAQVPLQQIMTFSLGESQAQQTSKWDETLFFDRRVTLHISPITTMTAAN